MKKQPVYQENKFNSIEEVKRYIRWEAKELIKIGFVKADRREVSFCLEGGFAEYPYDFFLGASKEVVNVFIRDCDAQRHAEDNHGRCQVKGKKGKTVICEGDCNDCPNSKRPDGERIGFRQGSPLSTELMLEDGLDIPDKNNPYEYLENEERIGALHKAVEQLPDERNRKIAQLLLEDDPLSEREIAEKMNVCQKTVNNRYHKICDFLSEALKDYR